MTSRLGLAGGQHTAGLYADMTVDGPEIGTLVVIVDRAKNLPNRRTMGKQDPYCAARLGKEARKTNTDVRGGQTPRWDQELRFIVHESPDYHNLKLSVFNDDKRTDLIGETWIGLMDSVIISGGGRHDGWHHLSYKGKYAGEIRIEMSYYDSRTPERPLSTDILKKKSPVKRRPLPTGPSRVVTPQFGPRKPGCARGETVYIDSDGNPTAPPPDFPEEPHADYSQMGGHFNPHQPDYLPQIPPKSTHRASLSHPPSQQFMLAHSRSAPNVQTAFDDPHNNGYTYHSDTVDFAIATNGVPGDMGQWDHQSMNPSHTDTSSWHGSQYDSAELPPLPPSHGNTPQHDRRESFDQQSYVSSVSPLQSVEHSWVNSPQSRRTSEYASPVRHSAGPSPLRREAPSPRQITHAHPGSSPISPFSRSVGSPSGMPPYPTHDHPGIARHSVSDPFAAVTPPKPAHPLSQEMRRSTSPQPYHGRPGYAEPESFHFPGDNVPVIKPRPQPTPRARHSIAAIRHPVSTFAAQHSPSTAPHAHPRGTPLARKSISPAVSPSSSGTSLIPFGPDGFDHLNPSSLSSQLDAQPNPHNPYHIPAAPAKEATNMDPTVRSSDGRILGFDGREIDPSDHLPVDSWAPEPETKTPTKQYGNGSPGGSRSFGPRSTTTLMGSSSSPGGERTAADIRVQVRSGHRGASQGSPSTSPAKQGRNRLVKKKHGGSSSSIFLGSSPGPLSEVEAPNWSNGAGGMMQYPPPKPPKIPMEVEDGGDGFGYGASALSREMAKIDIGGIGGRRSSRVGWTG